MIITRFAPSPTGNLHIGSARTALINFICKSKNKDSKLYLRIEDTDIERSKEEFKNNILSGLQWLGVNWDNEPQIQSQNINRHLEIANKLLDNGKALDIPQLASLIKDSSFVIANDTGPAHIAAHIGAKGLALFGKHTSANKVSIERENFKAIQVSDLSKLSAGKVFERLKSSLSVT